MKRLIYVILLILSILSCNRNIIDPNSLDTDEGIALGRVNIIENGNVCEDCAIILSDGYTEIHKTDLIIGKLGVGLNKIDKIQSSISTIFPVFGAFGIGHLYFVEGSTFRNYGNGKITYFGDVTINWDYDESLFSDDNGTITMTVKNNKSATLAEYQELTGNSIKNVVTSLVKVGR